MDTYASTHDVELFINERTCVLQKDKTNKIDKIPCDISAKTCCFFRENKIVLLKETSNESSS